VLQGKRGPNRPPTRVLKQLIAPLSTSLGRSASRIIPRSVLVGLLIITGVFAHPASAANVRLTTWNLDWFPNGKPKEAPPAEQERRIQGAADVLRSLDPDIILLQEIRDYDTCVRLAEAIKPHTYQVAICSAFKEPFQPGLGKQQVAILAKETAQAAWAERWKSMEGVDPPRGFAFAWFKIKGADVGVYSVHLKSNLVMHGDKAAETAKNVRKREVAAHQILSHLRTVIAKAIPNIRSEVVAGDFNTNPAEFPADDTLKTLEEAGFLNCMDNASAAQRITHPGGHGYPDTTFDYVLAQHAAIGPPNIVPSKVSDHYPVTCDVNIPSGPADTEAIARQPGAGVPTSHSAPLPPSTPVAGTTVTIVRPVTIQVPYGQTVLPSGMQLPLVSRDAQTVQVKYMGETQAIPLASTNLR
jgi:endonuclease/exonuclease/phosphatase family metal-dependent hydrolase